MSQSLLGCRWAGNLGERRLTKWKKRVQAIEKDLAEGRHITIRGQVQNMEEFFCRPGALACRCDRACVIS